MDKNTLLFIFILFLLSPQLLNMTWDIGKATIYIVILLLVLNTISFDTAQSIRHVLIKIINLDFSIVKDALAIISKFIISLFYSNKIPDDSPITDNIKSLLKPSSETNIIGEFKNNKLNIQ